MSARRPRRLTPPSTIIVLLLVAAAAALSPPAARAAEVGVTLGAGTTGLAAHLSVALTPSINARIGANYARLDFNDYTDDVDYKFKLKLNSFDLLLDWFPIPGREFRVSGGVVYNNNKIDATGRPRRNGTYTINGHTYSSSTVGNLDGNIEFRKYAPYVGVGWGNPAAVGKGWGWAVDLGLMFQGSGSTSLTSSGCTASTQVCSQLASDVAAENTRLSDRAGDYRAYPVIRAGATYRF